MDRSTLRALKCFLNPVTRIYQGGRAQIEPFKMVGMTLFFLGSRMPYHQMAGVFGVSEECFIRSTNYIISLLNDKCKEIIKWPRKEDYRRVADDFNQNKRRHFPNIIGAIDGCHVKISPRKNELKAYRNFKLFHSIHLQAVCLSDRRFTDIFVGYVCR